MARGSDGRLQVGKCEVNLPANDPKVASSLLKTTAPSPAPPPPHRAFQTQPQVFRFLEQAGAHARKERQTPGPGRLPLPV